MGQLPFLTIFYKELWSKLFSCWTFGWVTKTCRLLKAYTTNSLLLFAYSIPAILILACLDYHHYIIIVLRNTFQVFIVIYFTQRKLPCRLLGFNQDVLFYHNPLSNLFWPVGWRKRQFSDLSYWTIRQIKSPALLPVGHVASTWSPYNKLSAPHISGDYVSIIFFVGILAILVLIWTCQQF